MPLGKEHEKYKQFIDELFGDIQTITAEELSVVGNDAQIIEAHRIGTADRARAIIDKRNGGNVNVAKANALRAEYPFQHCLATFREYLNELQMKILGPPKIMDMLWKTYDADVVAEGTSEGEVGVAAVTAENAPAAVDASANAGGSNVRESPSADSLADDIIDGYDGSNAVEDHDEGAASSRSRIGTPAIKRKAASSSSARSAQRQRDAPLRRTPLSTTPGQRAATRPALSEVAKPPVVRVLEKSTVALNNIVDDPLDNARASAAVAEKRPERAQTSASRFSQLSDDSEDLCGENGGGNQGNARLSGNRDYAHVSPPALDPPTPAAKRRRNTRIRWTNIETNALHEAVALHGEGNWAIMLKDQGSTGISLRTEGIQSR